MAENEKDKLLDHDADGIQEYDNALPRWWLYGFYFTIVMSVIYIFYYHVYDGPDWDVLWYQEKSQVLEYEAQMADLEEMKANAPKGPAVEMVVMTDADNLAAGKAIFTENICYTCQRDDMGGLDPRRAGHRRCLCPGRAGRRDHGQHPDPRGL